MERMCPKCKIETEVDLIGFVPVRVDVGEIVPLYATLKCVKCGCEFLDRYD